LPPAVRREQILDAALELVVSEGFAAVSMEGIARAAGIAKTVVYDAFGDQDGLLRALLEREEQRIMADVAAILPGLPIDRDIELVVRDAVGASLRAVRARPNGFRLFLLPPDGTPPALRRAVARRQVEIIRQLEPIVAWGLRQRPALAGLDVELTARALLGLAENAARLSLEQPRRYTPQRLAAFAASLLALIPSSDAGPRRAR
jgi:AcrR family transcriptional regulator